MSLTLLLSIILLIPPSVAVKGRQIPNTHVTVPVPKVTSIPIASDTFIYSANSSSHSNDGESGPPGCHCQFLRRTKNITPRECLDYCVWRWAWY
ncbi:hypothetical protein H2200_006711 [Cladophialophora chaetospira]|uniref:Secreted protein n=1 Tax=Cladophialophora chaetospira TaxID=386627 RepID=A0AA39CHY1_9EURO|nr:hypothetical protein H2200_006711 [Cladophialophora chaetospira]